MEVLTRNYYYLESNFCYRDHVPMSVFKYDIGDLVDNPITGTNMCAMINTLVT